MYFQGKLSCDLDDLEGILDHGDDIEIVCEGTAHVAAVTTHWPCAEDEDDETGIDNARRLVACWNHCHGFTTETIEAGPDMAELVQSQPKAESVNAALLTEMMMTPGPWAVMWQNLRVSPGDPRCPEMWQVPVTPEGGGNVLAMAYGNTISGTASKEECEANARLIAAAPVLLAALKRLADALDTLSGHDYTISDDAEPALIAARTAIAAAEQQ